MRNFIEMNPKIWQIKLVVGVLIVAAALVWGWLHGGFGAAAPRQNQTPAVQDQIAGPANQEIAIVTKVLDGDTIIVQGGDHVRLLGIDADEADYPCYEPAKKRLEQLVLGKVVELEKDNEDLDQYGRQLRHIFLNGKNINEQMVAEGLAIARFYPQNQKYKNEIVVAETQAIQNKTGCKWKQ